MNGKGSKPRPFSVNYDKYAQNWDNIFAKKITVPVKTLDNGEQFIEIPETMLKELNWKEGDNILWTANSDGTFKLTKQ
jgi:hypothetical protein